MDPAVIRPAAARPLDARTQLRDEVVSYIREMVISGQKRPGAWLPLVPLAENLGVSITPVREALILLAQEGWLVQEPNRGFRVAVMRRKEVEDAYLVHAFVAGELAARAALAITPEVLDELRRIDEQIARNRDTESAALLNRQLHNRLNAVADSPRLNWFVEAASRFVPRRFWPTIAGWRDLNRHDDIIDALAARDPERSREVVGQHIRRAGELLLAHLDAAGFWAATDADEEGLNDVRDETPRQTAARQRGRRARASAP